MSQEYIDKEECGSQAITIHFNTIIIEGIVNAAGGTPQFSDCIWLDKTPTSTITANIRNNILYNTRSTPNTISSYPTNVSIHINSANINWVTSDYNLCFVNGEKSAIAAVGSPITGMTSYITLFDWSDETGNDSHSLSINPLFANSSGILPTDFVPAATLPGLFDPDITTDFDNDIRCLPTMGAQENLTPVEVSFDPTSSIRCQGEEPLIVSYIAIAINSSGITYSILPATAGTINTLTGEVIWNPSFSGTAVITATAAGCYGPATATHTVNVAAAPTTTTIWHR